MSIYVRLIVYSHCLSLGHRNRDRKGWVVWKYAECFTLHRDWDSIVYYCAVSGPCPGSGPGVSQCE